MTSVYLIVHGRLKQEVFDVQGKVIMTRYQTAGGQYGGVSAALAEPLPLECLAEDPSTLLKFDYLQCLELAKKYEQFRLNWLRILATAIKKTLFPGPHARPSTTGRHFSSIFGDARLNHSNT